MRVFVLPVWAALACAALAFGQPDAARSEPLPRTRDAAKLLVDALATAEEGARDRAAQHLADFSGRTDLGTDVAAWQAWLAEADAMTERAWQASIATAQAARAQAAESAAAEAQARLIASLRRLHLITPAAERATLLAELLDDPMACVQELGFELVQRELSAAADLGPQVGQSAVQLLASNNPKTRSRAAALVRQLAPEGAGGAVITALGRETDEAVAEDLLLALQRYQGPECVDGVLTWASSTSNARERALETLWDLTRAGHLRGDQQRARALAIARGIPVAERTPASIYLLDFLGSAEDAQAIAQSLLIGPTPVRQAAAQTLVWYEDLQPALLQAAEEQTELFPYAAQTQLVHRPTPHGYRLLLGLKGWDTPQGRDQLSALARAMTSPEIDTLLYTTTDPSLRQSLLEELVRPERMMTEQGVPEAETVIAAASWKLAQEALEDRRFDRAVTLLDRAPATIDNVAGAGPVSALRCAALIAFGRVDLAQATDAPASAWLQGVALCIEEPQALAAIAACEEKFGSVLTAEQRDALSALRAEAQKHQK